MIYIDVPQCPSNVFFLYSNATGIFDKELADGVDVRNVIYKPVITSQTKMTILSGASGFNKKGLHITPELSADGKQITFNLKMTACNMHISDYYTITVETAGDTETSTQGTSEKFKLKIMCYGCDRPFLGNNFVEYDRRDGRLYNVSMMPYAVNDFYSVGFGDVLLDGSGFTIYDKDDIENKNTLRYTGSPGLPGVYGLAVEAVTYEGGANVPGHVPNSFPYGIGADARIITIYDGYFKRDDTAFAVPYEVDLKFSNAPTDAPAGFNHAFSLYGGNMISTGSEISTGGTFIPVFDGDRWLYWTYKKTNQVANNTTETHEYRLLCNANADNPSGKLGNIWYLYYRYYLDENKEDAAWELLESIAGIAVDIPVKENNRLNTYKAFVSVPPYSGWNNAEAYGDAAYFVKGYNFFNTVSLVSPDNAFEPITVYAGNNNRLLVKSSEQNGKVFFPDLAGWGIIESGSIVPLDTTPQTIQYTVVPYAPAKEGDAAICLPVPSPDGTVLYAQALNSANTDMCIQSNNIAGGIWKRYPLQRLLLPDKFEAEVMLQTSTEPDKRYLYLYDSSSTGGTSIDRYGSVTVSNPCGRTVREDVQGNCGKSKIFAQVFMPLDGVVRNDKGIVNLYGFATELKEEEDPEIQFILPATLNKETSISDSYWHTVKRWHDDDVYEIVEKPGYGSHKVPKILGRKVHAIEEEYGVKDISTYEYTKETKGAEIKTTLNGKVDGLADVFLHVGQGSEEGRQLAYTASAVFSMRGMFRIPIWGSITEVVNGEVTREESLDETKTYEIDHSVTRAYAMVATELPNNPPNPDSQSKEDDVENTTNFRKWFYVRKRTAYTCRKYEYEVKNKLIGHGEYEVHWYPPGSNSPGDRVIETFTTDCYANEGEWVEIEYMYAVEEGAYGAYFCSNWEQGRPTYSLELRTDDTIITQYTKVNREVFSYKEESWNPAYPFAEISTKSTEYSWSQEKVGGTHTMITQDDRYLTNGKGQFTRKDTQNPSMIVGSNNPPPETYPEAETTTTKHRYSVGVDIESDLQEMFDKAQQRAGWIREDFGDPPEGEWDIIEKTAYYSEMPLYQGGGSCEYKWDSGEDITLPPPRVSIGIRRKR